QPSPNQNIFRPSPAGGSFFGSGFGRGFLGGLLGAGLIGLLFGHGLFGGLGSIASLIGFLLQVGLVVLLVRFALNWFSSRRAAVAGIGPTPGFDRNPTGRPTGTAAPSPVL